ncbi:hypothetical protein CI109_106050 [Kwoniella shandongensis]|uniref:Uncharacterized protein n=1 Tax=Kwoniella shandongensis TaxID=1734106 RepID=A0A5M6BXP9_9TREE|nr:uncharacterized protein CI109_003897 [Kwoniella shandongensis]KAA5527638.1 hypothetical protein CI109_003897 [Kwoniella shandongensis]
MAPNQFDLISSLHRRQAAAAAAPACVTTCMATGDTTGCTGFTDYTCICASSTYINSVASCFASSCNASESALGQAYSQQACAYYGSPLSSSNTTSSSTSATSTIAPVSTSGGTANPIQSVFFGNPETMSSAFEVIQAVMSSICGALLILAIVLGVMSCRTRYRREQQMSQNRTWTGVGSTAIGTETKTKGSRFFSRTANSSAFTNSRNPGTTLASDTFGVTSSNFSGSTTVAGSPNHVQSFGPTLGKDDSISRNGAMSPERFSNRVVRSDGDEWEMDVKKDYSEEYDDELSPTASSSRMGMGSEVDLVDEGSTVHLNRLDKGDGPRAI